MATLKNTTIDSTDYLQFPRGTTAQRPGSPAVGMTRYNTDINSLEWYTGTEWFQANVLGLSASSPAASATALKTSNPSVTNGAYWYRFGDGGVRQLWTDFTTYAPLNFVMVTRIWNGSQNQYLTTEENVTDLALTPVQNTPATRHAKLSDNYMNDIIQVNTIRWGIAGNGSTFYRLDDNPQWYSNHGASQTCSYDRGFYSGYATPSSSPTWISNGTYQACGGSYDSGGNWLTLTGIHTNDATYFGGYSGNSTARAAPPTYLQVGTGLSDSQWSQNGWVFLQW